jgi:hypothetical protein
MEWRQKTQGEFQGLDKVSKAWNFACLLFPSLGKTTGFTFQTLENRTGGWWPHQRAPCSVVAVHPEIQVAAVLFPTAIIGGIRYG